MNCCNYKAIETHVEGITPTDGKMYWHVDEDYLTDDMDKAKVLFSIQQAFAFWQVYIPVPFASTNDKSKAAIIIRFAKNGDAHLPFDFENGVLAYAFFPEGRSLDYTSDIYLNDAENWQDAYKAQSVNLYHILVHEIGHSLGLGHSEDESDVMFAYYDPNQAVKVTLETIEGLYSLYGHLSNSVDLSNVFLTKKELNRLYETTLVRMANQLGIEASIKDRKSETLEKVFDLIQ